MFPLSYIFYILSAFSLVTPPTAPTGHTVGDDVVLCRGLYLYAAPAQPETLREISYWNLPARLTDGPHTAPDGDWWHIESELYRGWVSADDLAACGVAPVRTRYYLRAYADQFQPGDIVLARRTGLFCRANDLYCWLLEIEGGRYLHTLMIAEQDGQLVTVDASPNDGGRVRVAPFADSPLHNFEHVVVLRVAAPPDVRQAAARYALRQAGKPFNDVLLDKQTTDSFYCSQLIWRAYQQAGGPNLDADTSAPQVAERVGFLPGLPLWLAAWGVVSPDELYHSPAVSVIGIHE